MRVRDGLSILRSVIVGHSAGRTLLIAQAKELAQLQSDIAPASQPRL